MFRSLTGAGGPADGGSLGISVVLPECRPAGSRPVGFRHPPPLRSVVRLATASPGDVRTLWFAMLSGDWQFSGVLQCSPGLPMTVTGGKGPVADRTGARSRRASSGEPYGPGACQNTAPCVDYINPASVRCCRTSAAFGNTGKGSLRCPGNGHLGRRTYSRTFRLRERWRIQFRAEFFNVLNRVNYKAPDQTNQTNNVSAGGFGSIRAANDPRIGQLALKIVF